MKRIAIMQPYLFPYLGYFQLVQAVDKFVFYDDVNYIKNGWINRNRLLLNGESKYFTVPLDGASPFQKICAVKMQPGRVWHQKMLNTFQHAYGKTPYFSDIFPLIQSVLLAEQTQIGEIAKQSVVAVADYLHLPTQFVWSSMQYGNAVLTGAERVLDICTHEAAQNYYNLPGGMALYNEDLFSAQGIVLKFIQPELAEYRQCCGLFQPGLSILDVLMFNDRETVIGMLGKYELI